MRLALDKKKKSHLSLLKMFSCLSLVINTEVIFRQKPLVRQRNESGNVLFLRVLTSIFVSFSLSLLMAVTSAPQSALEDFLGRLSCESMHHRTNRLIAGMAFKVPCHLFCGCRKVPAALQKTSSPSGRKWYIVCFPGFH